MDSWDTPRQGTYLTSDGFVADELLIGIDDWSNRYSVMGHIAQLGDTVLGAIPRLGVVRVRISSSASRADRAEAYAVGANVDYVHPNALVLPDSIPPPTDPDFPKQWQWSNTGQSGGYPGADIDALQGWSIAVGDPSVTVAVLDTGCNLSQPEFADRLVPGWDFVDEDSDPSAVGDHGTFVTGLLGANTDNDFEVTGVDHYCKIMPVRVLTGGTTFDLAQGLDFVAQQGVDVVTMSLGYPADLPVVASAVEAVAASGAMLVASAGNSEVFGFADIHWPAAYPLVVSVGWSTKFDLTSIESATGSTLDVVAPGQQVITVSPDGTGASESFSGSSAAAPSVAGMLSVMKGLNKYLSRSQLTDALLAGAEDLVGNPFKDVPGWDPYYGWGRVNLRRSLELLCGCQGGESLIATPQHVSVAAGEVVAFRVDVGRELAGQPYWIFGSSSGSNGWPFGPLTLPLTLDEYTRYTVSDANGAVLVDTRGLLDVAGQAMGFLILPNGVAVGAQGVLHHVAVVFDGRAKPANAVLASNVTATLIEP